MRHETIFDAVRISGYDDNFEPRPNELFFPTMFSPGSDQKIEVLRQRLELGLPLWHPKDQSVCSVVGVGAEKERSTYGKTASFFAARRNKLLSD